MTSFRSKIKPVGSVTATSNSDNLSIVVSWPSPIASGQPTGGFVLYRNGTQIASLGATVRTYTDTTVVTATTYSYEVVVVSTGSQQSVQTASNSVRLPSPSGGNIVTAASASLADVQAAVNAAVDGDTVLIPNGSVTWTGGITTTKQIIIKAQNTTPTPGGTMTRNVTITNNAGSTPLFSFTTGNSYSCGVIGIRFNVGSGTGNYVKFIGSGSKPPLIGDCAYQCDGRNANGITQQYFAMTSLGGVIWNTYGLGTGAWPGGASICIESPRAWQSASTVGMLDSLGNINVYLEDCTFLNVTTTVDVDAGGRAVLRHCLHNGSFISHHGFSSGLYGGGRHTEVYDNTFNYTDGSRNSYIGIWLRCSTAIVTGNSFASIPSYQYGDLIPLSMGDDTGPSGDNQPMQIGWGHNGTTDIREPVYYWSNTGARANADRFVNGWDAVTTVATTPGQANGEYFKNLGGPPGWTRYTYPHPARPY